MSYVENQGVGIHYTVEGEGPPLVLMHGLGQSIDMWRRSGYVEALRGDFRLILIDSRGHGASSRPRDPEAYRMALRVGDVVAVLNDLDISEAHYLGYSMGAWIGWGIAKYAPERFRSLILGGRAPAEDPRKGHPLLESLKSGMETTLAAAKSVYGSGWTSQVKAMVLAMDLEALVALLSLRERVGYEDMLPTLTVPCLIYVGEADGYYSGAKKASEVLPNATFVSLPGLDHVQAARIDLVLPHVREFLAEMSPA